MSTELWELPIELDMDMDVHGMSASDDDLELLMMLMADPEEQQYDGEAVVDAALEELLQSTGDIMMPDADAQIIKLKMCSGDAAFGGVTAGV